MERRLINDFDPRLVNASKSVLLEIMTILGSYRKALILIGGWAPYFIIEQFRPQGDEFIHAGSLDVDILVNPELVSDKEYKSILRLIEERGYRQAFDAQGRPIPSAFVRELSIPGYTEKQKIEVDFLGPEYGGRGKTRRHQIIQSELFARKARGADFVFDHHFTYRLKSALPSGAKNEVDIQVAEVVSSLTTKGMAIGERNYEKDAYDIYAVVSHYKDGPKDVSYVVRPFIKNSLVKEGIEKIREKFKSKDSIGPSWVADFLTGGRMVSTEERDRIITDAYMRVNEFLRHLGKESLI